MNLIAYISALAFLSCSSIATTLEDSLGEQDSNSLDVSPSSTRTSIDGLSEISNAYSSQDEAETGDTNAQGSKGTQIDTIQLLRDEFQIDTLTASIQALEARNAAPDMIAHAKAQLEQYEKILASLQQNVENTEE